LLAPEAVMVDGVGAAVPAAEVVPTADLVGTPAAVVATVVATVALV